MPAKDFYVYSTLASDVDYRTFTPNGANDLPTPSEPLIVKGGTGVANDRVITPQGVRSGPFTQEQAEVLENHYLFQMHEKNGFVVMTTEKMDPENVAADMTGRDNSAPMVPEDATAGGAKAVMGTPAKKR